MTGKEIFDTLGITPTEDYSTIRKAYLNKLKRLNRKLAKVRGTEGQDLVSGELTKLNSAFNFINEYRNDLNSLRLQAENEEMLDMWDEDTLSQLGIETEAIDEFYEMHTQADYTQPSTNVNIENLKNSLTVKWEPKTSELVEEIITLRDFLNGTIIMMENGDTLDIPPRFLGIMTRIIDGKNPKIQFIRVLSKDAVVMSYTASGDLRLKTIPENATFEKGILRFSFADNDFEFDLNELDALTPHTWVGVGQGLTTFGVDTPGDLYLDKSSLVSTKNPKVVSDIFEFMGWG